MSLQRSFTTLRRVSWAGVLNFGRNAWLSIAASAVMFVALTVVLAGAALNLVMRDTINEYSEQFTVGVYLKDSATKERIDELQKELENQDFIERTVLVTKDEALSRFQERFKESPDILEGFNVAGGNSLPASIEVVLKEVERSSDVEPVATSGTFKDDVVSTVSVGKTGRNNQDAQTTVQWVSNAKKLVSRASIAMSLVFAGISVLIIFNTIRMAIFTRSEEIKIMKLIGATPGYIRAPFLVESALYGIIAGTLAYGAVTAGLVAAGRSSIASIPIEPTIALYKSNWFLIYLAIITVGALIGLISSLLAMEKYLKLKRW